MWASCWVRSDSHLLNDEAFRLLTLPQSEIRVSNVSERQFLLSIHGVEGANEASQVLHAHLVARAFLVALNVATVGMFYWSQDPWVHPVLQVSQGFGEPADHEGALIWEPDTVMEPLKSLDQTEVRNATIIFGVLAKDRSDALETEYAKGLLLLRMRFLDTDFNREAFLCFYRALENFVAARILKVAKFKNELKDLGRGISQVGASQDVLDELQSVYVVRSSQAAHSQVTPRAVTLDEVLKAKTFLDLVMHKTFKAQGVQMLKARGAQVLSSDSESAPVDGAGPTP